ncbi:MAG: hypothetical protein V4505_13785, partial [Pseudomonadota bacterium]
MKKTIVQLATAGALLALAGCGGGGGDAGPGTPRFISDMPLAIAGFDATTNFNFDIGAVSGNQYFITNRTNASLDVFDTTKSSYTESIKGSGPLAFAGPGPGASKFSGPDGLAFVGGLAYVGDVNSMKVVDPATHAVKVNIPIGTFGVRADENCYDAVHGIVMVSTPEAPSPYAAFVNVATNTVVAKVTFNDATGAPSAGLEACRYDAATDNWYVNNDGSTANPHGELVKLPAAPIRALPAGSTANHTQIAGVGIYPEGNCDPTGLALGPGTDIAIGCRPAAVGTALNMLFFNRVTGALVKTINAGGGDQLEYDPVSNRYFNSTYHWTASGAAAACTAADPCTPTLTVVDAATMNIVTRLPTGNFSHSVAVDSATGRVFVPYSSANAPAGCSTCTANGFVKPGVSVFST